MDLSSAVKYNFGTSRSFFLIHVYPFFWRFYSIQINTVYYCSPLFTAVTSIHAKFDVTSGPSLPQPAEVKFVCDGCTLSGVDLDLMGTDYRVSLLKRKFSSGM